MRPEGTMAMQNRKISSSFFFLLKIYIGEMNRCLFVWIKQRTIAPNDSINFDDLYFLLKLVWKRNGICWNKLVAFYRWLCAILSVHWLGIHFECWTSSQCNSVLLVFDCVCVCVCFGVIFCCDRYLGRCSVSWAHTLIQRGWRLEQ